jgi:hypothetical protein
MNLAPDGRLLVAGHPSLLSLGLYRYRWFGRDHAASRILALSADGQREVLVAHPRGNVLSAATAAAQFEGRLIAGSVTDDGLMVCELPTGRRARD